MMWGKQKKTTELNKVVLKKILVYYRVYPTSICMK